MLKMLIILYSKFYRHCIYYTTSYWYNRLTTYVLLLLTILMTVLITLYISVYYWKTDKPHIQRVNTQYSKRGPGLRSNDVWYDSWSCIGDVLLVSGMVALWNCLRVDLTTRPCAWIFETGFNRESRNPEKRTRAKNYMVQYTGSFHISHFTCINHRTKARFPLKFQSEEASAHKSRLVEL